jgi:hypothetical protein
MRTVTPQRFSAVSYQRIGRSAALACEAVAERKPASSITLPTAIDFDTAELALLISEGVRNVQIGYMRNERRQSASGPFPAIPAPFHS